MLPEKENKAFKIELHSSQVQKTRDSIDPRVFGLRTFNIIYGSRRSGKTVLLSNVIKEFYLTKKAFDAIIVLTPSVDDPAWNLIKGRKRVSLLKTCSDQFLRELMEAQEESIAEGGKKKTPDVLVVIDDFATMGKRLPSLDEIATRGRNLNMTVIITTQYSKLLAPVIRRNADNAVLFRLDEDELADLAKEGLRCGITSTKDFVKWALENTKVPRSFVTVHKKAIKDENVFRIGFSEPI